MCHLDHHRKFPTKIIGRAIWILMLQEAARTPKRIEPKPTTKLSSTVRPANSCVPVSVERVDKDKDADENVDADQTSMGRPVKSGYSIGLFTQPRRNRH